MAVIEKTFDCNPSATADFHNLEECCGWTPPCPDNIIYHTYPFDNEYTITTLTITTKFRKTYDSRMSVYIDFQIDGSWIRKAEYYNPYGDQMTQIIPFEPFNATAFRIKGQDVMGNNPLFAYTRGSLLVEEPIPPECEAYTNQIDCENAGCYWYDDSCHTEPKPPPEGFPWIYVIIAGIGVVALIALIKKE